MASSCAFDLSQRRQVVRVRVMYYAGRPWFTGNIVPDRTWLTATFRTFRGVGQTGRLAVPASWPPGIL